MQCIDCICSNGVKTELQYESRAGTGADAPLKFQRTEIKYAPTSKPSGGQKAKNPRSIRSRRKMGNGKWEVEKPKQSKSRPAAHRQHRNEGPPAGHTGEKHASSYFLP